MSTSAIVGLGFAGLRKSESRSAEQLAVAACLEALDDAGLRTRDVDGLVICRSPTAGTTVLNVGLQRAAGLPADAVCTLVDAKGASGGQTVHLANLLLEARRATTVVCVFADSPRRPGLRAGSTFTHATRLTDAPELDEAAGLRSPASAFAFLARMYLDRYDVGGDSFAAVAIAAKELGLHNPHAVAPQSVSTAEYFASEWVTEPLRALDCSMPVNGAAALVMTTADRAKDLAAKPVSVRGCGESGAPAPFPIAGLADLGVRRAVEHTLAAAGAVLSEVTFFELYDAFTVMPVVAVEELRLCEPGAGREFIANRAAGPAAAPAVNAGGGQLGAYYLQGMTPVMEAAQRLREALTPTLALSVSSGGMFDHHACVLLGAEP